VTPPERVAAGDGGGEDCDNVLEVGSNALEEAPPSRSYQIMIRPAKGPCSNILSGPATQDCTDLANKRVTLYLVRSRSVTFLLRAGPHIASLASLPDSPVSPVLFSCHRDLILGPRRSEERADRSEVAAIDSVSLPLMKKQQERPTGLINSFDFLVDSGYAFYMMSDRANWAFANMSALV